MNKKAFYLSVTRDANGTITLARQVTKYYPDRRTGDALPYMTRTLTPLQAERIAVAMRGAMTRLNIFFRPYLSTEVGWIAEWTRPC